MRRRHLALALGIVAVVAFAFFVPIASVPSHSPCYYGCFSQVQYGSLTHVLLGHGGYYVGILPWGRYSIWRCSGITV